MESATFPFFELLRLVNARPPVTLRRRSWHTAQSPLVVPFDYQISLRRVGAARQSASRLALRAVESITDMVS